MEMKRSIHYLEFLYCHLLIVFLIGRVGFVLNNRCVEQLSFMETLGACRRGLLGHDVVVAAMLLVVPWLAGLLALRFPSMRLRSWLVPYYVLMGIAVAAIVAGDAVLYEYWRFKLGMVVLSYASHSEGVTNSVSLSYILMRFGAFLSLALWTMLPCIFLTPKRLSAGRGERLWMRNVSIIWVFLVVSGLWFVRQSDVYSVGGKVLANHAAVNPVYAFASSVRLGDDFSRRYDFLPEWECSDLVWSLYSETGCDVRDTLLTTRRPDVLVVFMESFGSRFVEELGGLPGVAPGLSRMIPEGVFWENYYSNSFRTDRGTVSAFNGWLSYTDVGLMKHTEMHGVLPSLPRSLEREGYETSFIYAGQMTNMGKREYLENVGFRHLYDDTAFSADQASGSWGVYDSISCQKAVEIVGQWKGGHHFMVVQTLSSHEPWDVPYHRLDDKILTAFAYTDHSVACMVDSLRRLPQWDNLLVVMLPDHGYLYRQGYDDPGFFRAPMLWMGGAVREPRRMDVLMNQSDLAATLLSQMGIPHDDYPWSRNVLSSKYTYPFVYCNWPAGLLFADSTGTSVYDLDGEVLITDRPADDGHRLLHAKAILQGSYNQLETMRRNAPYATPRKNLNHSGQKP